MDSRPIPTDLEIIRMRLNGQDSDNNDGSSDDDVSSVSSEYRAAYPGPINLGIRRAISISARDAANDTIVTRDDASVNTLTAIPPNVAQFMAVRDTYITACSAMVNELDGAAAAVVLPVSLQDIEAKIANIDHRWQATPDAWSVAEDGKLDLSDDPQAVVEINNRHRHAAVLDGAGSDLWTVNQWHASGPRIYKFNAPTIAPSRWGCESHNRSNDI